MKISKNYSEQSDSNIYNKYAIFGRGYNNRIIKNFYLISIHRSKKNSYVPLDELEVIITWLRQSGVYIIDYDIECHGLYNQPHIHALAQYKGEYKPLSKFGDARHFPLYQIHWKHVHDYNGCLQYIHKQNEYNKENQLAEHFYKYNYGFNQNH